MLNLSLWKNTPASERTKDRYQTIPLLHGVLAVGGRCVDEKNEVKSIFGTGNRLWEEGGTLHKLPVQIEELSRLCSETRPTTWHFGYYRVNWSQGLLAASFVTFLVLFVEYRLLLITEGHLTVGESD